MKILFKLLLLIICFPLCFTGCKKDNSTNSSSYLKGKVDGGSFECNSNIWATPKGAGDKIISFRGDWLNYSIRFYLDGQGSDITEGSYNFQTGKIYNAILYQNNDGYSAGYFCGSFSGCTFEGSGKITFLEISKKNIRGTFEFVTPVSGATGILKTVTNGEFDIKRD
jgi:hypothetical protein